MARVIQGLVFSPDGRLVLTHGIEGTARIWDTVGNCPVGSPAAPRRRDHAFGIPARRRRLVVTASLDHTARLWDAATGLPKGAPMRHRLFLRDAAFAPDGKTVLTASADGTAKLWVVGPGDMTSIVPTAEAPHASAGFVESARPGASFQKAAFSLNGDRVLLGNGDGLARLVESATGEPLGAPMKHRWPATNAFAFSPDGHRVATASLDLPVVGSSSTRNTCQIWDADTGRPASPWLPHLNWVAGQAFRPDGKVLATGDFSGAVRLWDVVTGANLSTLLNAGQNRYVLRRTYARRPDPRGGHATEPANQVVICGRGHRQSPGRVDPVPLARPPGHLQRRWRCRSATRDRLIRQRD